MPNGNFATTTRKFCCRPGCAAPPLVRVENDTWMCSEHNLERINAQGRMTTQTLPPPIPRPEKKPMGNKSKFIFAAKAIGIFYLIAWSPIIFQSSTENDPEKKKKDEIFSHDIRILDAMANVAATDNSVIKAETSGWNSSLDITIGNRNAYKADALASAVCSNKNLIDKKWRARVFFADGSQASECFINGS